jgi:uncharacterized protein YbcI
MTAVPLSEVCEAPAGGELNAGMARGIVRIHRSTVGRGPRRARAFFHGNVFVVLLSNVMTRADHALMASGHRDAVLIGRQTLLEAMRPELVATAETVIGCRVESLLADTSPEADMTALVFVLDRAVQSGG